MIDMYDQPQELHQLMAILRDRHLAKLDFLEEQGLLCPNHNHTIGNNPQNIIRWCRIAQEEAERAG